MQYRTLIEILSAVHLSQFVDTKLNKNRSGMFLVAPPGCFKTTITDVMDEFPKTKVLSDINVQSLVKMKDHFISGTIRTLAFSDYTKLYKRNPAVARNVEGSLMALAEEGFRRASFQSQSVEVTPAYCVILGGITTGFFDANIDQWIENGFARRFVFARYTLDPLSINVLERAIDEQRHAILHQGFIPKVPVGKIDGRLTKEEIEYIDYSTRHILYGELNNRIMLQKILAVLNWKFSHKEAMQILKEFTPCLSKNGGILYLEEPKK